MSANINFFLLVIIACICYTGCEENINSDYNCPPDLTVPMPPTHSPVWHPDGKYIGFNYWPIKEVTYPNGSNCSPFFIWNDDSMGFWILSLEDGSKKRIFPSFLQCPDWSPGGDWLSFVVSGNIYKMRFNESLFDTSSLIQLTFEGRNYHPSWSLEGHHIAYDSNVDHPEGGYRVWIMGNDGSDKTLIVDGRTPVFTNNDSSIVFRGLHSELYEYDLFKNEITRRSFFNESNSSFFIRDQRYSAASNMLLLAYGDDKTPPITYSVNCDSYSDFKKISDKILEVNMGTPLSWNKDGTKFVFCHFDGSEWKVNNGYLWIHDLSDNSEYQIIFDNID